MHVLIVGAGMMGYEYTNVLKSLNIPFTVVGRSLESVEKFNSKSHHKAYHGGIENIFNQLNFDITHAIVASSLADLVDNTIFLLNQNIKNILVEKPGSFDLQGLIDIQNEAKKTSSNVYIAYNRRFYGSVIEAKKRILKDGGISSFIFEFTEWSHVISNHNIPKLNLENWFIGNSTHVIDTAFYLAGVPKKISGFTTGELQWHPKGSIFVGSGLTINNIPFSYHANWQAPGSWKLEVLTNKNRYIFRPFEKLHIQKLGDTNIELFQFDDTLDTKFKPGLYKQVDQFLNGNKHSELLSIIAAVENFKWYTKMLDFKEDL